ncbi:MAG: hypothetical protein U0797_30390 [Gemmataceae bacterium]
MSTSPSPDDRARYPGSRTVSTSTLVLAVFLAIGITAVVTVVVMSGMVLGSQSGGRPDGPPFLGGRGEGPNELVALWLLGGAMSERGVPALGTGGLLPVWLKAIFLVLLFAILVYKIDRVSQPRRLRLSGLLLAGSLAVPSALLLMGSLFGRVGVQFLLLTAVIDLALFAASVYVGLLALMPQVAAGHPPGAGKVTPQMMAAIQEHR